MRSGTKLGMSIALIMGLALCVPAGAQGATFQIVFQSDRDGRDSDLWLIDSDGDNERQLTKNATPDATPSWSPDGSAVVYACAPKESWDLCAVDVATGEVKQLTNTSVDEFDPRYTADGEQIVLETYPAARNADIAIMPAEGGVPKRLTSSPAVNDQDPSPDTRDSDRIVFASDGRISLLDIRNLKTVRRVTDGSPADTDPYVSSRDEIAFAGERGTAHDIFVAGAESASGARKVRRLTRGIADDVEPAWTTDSARIIFARATAGRGFRIFTMTKDGRDLRALTKGGSYDDAEPAPGPVSVDVSPTPTMRFDVRAAVTCNSLNTITGNSSNNKRYGTDSANCIYGLAGNDRLYGRGGGDKLYGGSGNDYLKGGTGNDRHEGGSGNDSGYGDSGDDHFHETDGQRDFVDGGTGDDDAWVDEGDDVVHATEH